MSSLLASSIEVRELLFHLIIQLDNLVGATTGLFSAQCSRETCPGSFYNMITTAWANIGYATHSDFIKLVTETELKYWAPLIYVVGAIGGLISVALNSPPRNYAWFFVGPALFYFLLTPSPSNNIYGVAWRVAGQDIPMKDVWKNAEVGIVNTKWADSKWQQYQKDTGHGSTIQVGQGLLFLDGLFSETTNILIAYVGVGQQRGQGGAQSNLAAFGGGEGPWHLMANEKWGMLENIVGVTARDPDVRDALITFLASECGDQFKKGIDDGRYIAASTSRGKSLPKSVFRGGPTGEFTGEFGGGIEAVQSYSDFQHGLDGERIPTPRSLIRLFDQPNQQGSFKRFSSVLQSGKPEQSGRTVEIVCSEYLWTIVQALRWESGHAYWQLLRSAPAGFSEEQVLNTLFYGWDIRKTPKGDVASADEMRSFVKLLSFLYMLRNELMFAPQITENGQRFAPSEQTRNFTEAYVRDQGSKAKAGELYNWAVLMPYVQGILAYLILIGYPFAAMLMVIPGQWKAFYTWVTFFAWIKLWDVGFAIVHSLERSVWAMIGNRSSMALVGNVLLQTADGVGVDVSCSSGGGGSDAASLCAVPEVKEQSSSADSMGQVMIWMLLDRMLVAMGAADLDLSNGYYIYIMAALYFAVPAVTGQLVLGAKAGMASLATQAIGQNAQEAGGAAKSGAAGEANQRIGQVGTAIGQAATAKSHRKSGLAAQMFDTQNQALDAGLEGERIKNTQGAIGARAGALENLGKSYGGARGVIDSMVGLGQSAMTNSGTGSSTGSGTGGVGEWLKYGGRVGTRVGGLGMDIRGNELNQAGLAASVDSSARGVDAAWLGSQQAMRGKGFDTYAGRLNSAAEFEAQSAAWEAKNAWGSQISGIAGVYGANPGGLVGQKPTDMTGLAMSGNLGRGTQQGASYSGFGFLGNVNGVTRQGIARHGSQSVLSAWGGGYPADNHQQGVLRAGKEGLSAAPQGAEILKELPDMWKGAEKSGPNKEPGPNSDLLQGLQNAVNERKDPKES